MLSVLSCLLKGVTGKLRYKKANKRFEDVVKVQTVGIMQNEDLKLNKLPAD
jgi:hypothetical protein